MRNIMGKSALIIDKEESDKLRLDSKTTYSNYQLPHHQGRIVINSRNGYSLPISTDSSAKTVKAPAMKSHHQFREEIILLQSFHDFNFITRKSRKNRALLPSDQVRNLNQTVSCDKYLDT